MTLPDLLLDGLLVLLTLLVGALALYHRRVFACAVLFIVYGLLLALAWLRLAAPDVALAEAAIGAGVTGALLIATLARLADGERPGKESGSEETTQTPED